jgi:hypothetical protein
VVRLTENISRGPEVKLYSVGLQGVIQGTMTTNSQTITYKGKVKVDGGEWSALPLGKEPLVPTE